MPPFLFSEFFYVLHIVATPIGNIQDITLRAIQTLKDVEYILAEDTRVSSHLLKTFDIDTPLRSFHAFSEKKQEAALLSELKNGVEIALISDAGMPCISDPGSSLIRACNAENIPLTVYPGPTAPITALVAAGLGDHPFQFRGFFPTKKQTEEIVLASLYQGITIYYEAPHRFLKTISLFPNDAMLTYARELTKKFETVATMRADEMVAHFSKQPPRGEFVLLVHGYNKPIRDPKEHVAYLQKTFEIDQKMAIKIASETLGIGKREVYRLCHDM